MYFNSAVRLIAIQNTKQLLKVYTRFDIGLALSQLSKKVVTGVIRSIDHIWDYEGVSKVRATFIPRLPKLKIRLRNVRVRIQPNII